MEYLNCIKKYIIRLLKSPLFGVCLICLVTQFFIYRQTDSYSEFPDSKSYTYEYGASFRKFEVDGYRTPIYPLFARIVKIFSSEENWLLNIARTQKVLFFTSIPIVYFLTKRLTKSNKLSCLVSILYGCCPSLVFWNVSILTESLSLVLFIAFAYFVILSIDAKNKWYDFAAAITVALLVLTRPAAIYLLVIYLAAKAIVLFWAFWKKNKKIQHIISMSLSVLPVLAFMFMMLIQHNSFGLSCVGYINDAMIMVDSGSYLKSDEQEMVDFISEKSKEYDAFTLKELFDEEYGDGEFWSFYERNSSKLTMFDKTIYAIKKALAMGSDTAWTIYVGFKGGKQINIVTVLNVLYPISFSTIYCFLIIEFVIACYLWVKKKQVDLVVTSSFITIAGNLFVAMYGAPYETARLCLLVIPIFIISSVYIFSMLCFKKNNNPALSVKLLSK